MLINRQVSILERNDWATYGTICFGMGKQVQARPFHFSTEFFNQTLLIGNRFYSILVVLLYFNFGVFGDILGAGLDILTQGVSDILAVFS